MEAEIKQAWLWLGHEVMDFGARWVVIVVLGAVFGIFAGKRYRALKRENRTIMTENAAIRAENKTIRERLAVLENTLGPEIGPRDTITEHGVLTKGATGYPERLTTWEAMKEGAIAPPPAGPPSEDEK